MEYLATAQALILVIAHGPNNSCYPVHVICNASLVL